MDHRDQPDNHGGDLYAHANALMMNELVAHLSGEPNPVLTDALNDILERAVQAALADERDRCLQIVESAQPIIRPGEAHADAKATLRAVATLIRLGF